jgi:hypothetical protein
MSKGGLKSAQKKAASLARSMSSGRLGGKESNLSTFILEKLPSKDLEGDFQVSIWANG